MSGPDEAALYGDDEDHPLPYLDRLDMVGALRTGGAHLFIVVSGPLHADERSQSRLLRKFDGYLSFIASPDFGGEFGAPDPSTTRIVVRIDPASDPAIFELLRRCEPWVREAGATLVVDTSLPSA